MKNTKLITLILIIFIISCGKSKKELEIEKAKIEEEKKIHNEKIEAGKAKLKIELENFRFEIRKEIENEKNALNETNKFQLGRLNSTRENQINEHYKKINEFNVLIKNIENEIIQSNIKKTFEFQNTPEGVINHIFNSAKNNDFSKFRYLIDPYVEKRNISLLFIDWNIKESRDKFSSEYKKGRIIGDTKIANNKAEIEIAYGEESNKLTKMELVKRLDKWYIY